MEQTFGQMADNARNKLQNATSAAADSVKDVMRNGTDRAMPQTDRLFESFKTLIADGEEVMNSLMGASSENISIARDRFSQRLATAKQAYQDAESNVRSRVSDATHSADQYVSENPWRAVAIAASAGAIVAFLMQRASSRDPERRT